MRTTDFSKAPKIAQATAMFIGATQYRSPLAIIRLCRDWFPMIRQMKRMPGYRWHKVYYEFPFTLGTIAFFADRDSMLAFARNPTHRKLMRWITRGTKNGTAGFIRLYTAEQSGYSNGSWRAEENTMAHIEHFTPTSNELASGKIPPSVADHKD